MRSRRVALMVVGATFAVGAAAPAAANAAITMSSPVTHNLYVDNVFVSWSTTTTPTQIQMVWTCTAGYCLNTVTSPITLDLASTSSHSSFSFNPSSTTQSDFSNWPGPMPDGTWSIQMKYTDTSEVTYLSSTILDVQTSTETLPPTLTDPPANTVTNATAIPISYTLWSTPSTTDPTLTFTNTTTSTSSVLSLSPTVTSGSFDLDPADLTASSSVVGLSGPNSLADGAYDVTLSYADDEGHPAASTTNSGWTLERTTQEPSLSAPAAGSVETGPFDVTFDLPEAALSGSVQLVFSGGSTPITLSLSDTAAGTHTVAIDPDDLESASEVASSSANVLPAGTYDVAVVYQDALGNPASTSASTSLSVAGSPTTSASPTATPPPATTPTVTTVPTTPVATAPSPTPVDLSPRLMHARLAALSRHRIRTSLELPAAGDLQIIATADDPHVPWASISPAHATDDRLALLHPGWHRFTFASVTTVLTRGGQRSYILTPSRRGEALILRHRRHGWALHVRLTIDYIGSAGQRITSVRYVEILAARSQRR